MSGVEVAGLVLGAVPVLIEAIEAYKKGFSKLKAGFRKRKIVEKIGRALIYQKSIIELITRSILVQSGCEDAAGASEPQLSLLLQESDTQAKVDEYLGKDNAKVFASAFQDCMTSICHATNRLASLVPELAFVKNDTNVQGVLDANAALEKGQAQILARITLVLNLQSLEDEIMALDRSTDQLDKFARNVTVAHHPGPNEPSRKAIRLAKVLQTVRGNAVILHTALAKHWTAACHQRHELKVFLEDRVADIKDKKATNETETNRFKVVFEGDLNQSNSFCHETLFHIEPEVPQIQPQASQIPRVKFCAPQNLNIYQRQDVHDICAAIADATCVAKYPQFYFIGARGMAMTLHTQQIAASTPSRLSSTTLRAVLEARQSNPSSVSPLPWKWRMVLALKLASSFLQFIRTPWAQPSWSSGHIHIPHKLGTQELDLGRPFLTKDFSSASSATASQCQVKEDLLDLGVLLLEIWHENTLDIQFLQELASTKTLFMRRACALQWLEDTQNPLPDLYHHAASQCVTGLVSSGPQNPAWDQQDLWKSLCENVIDPLSKVAQI